MADVPSLLQRLQRGSLTLQEAAEALRESAWPKVTEALDDAFSVGYISAEQYEELVSAAG